MGGCDFLTVDEVAERLRVKPATVRDMVRGDLPAYKIGKHIRVSAAELEKWIEGKRVAGIEPMTLKNF